MKNRVLAWVVVIALLTGAPLWGQDLTTDLALFLRDLRAGTIGVAWANLTSITFDLGSVLVEEAVDVLAQRRGTNAQTLNVGPTTGRLQFVGATTSGSVQTVGNIPLNLGSNETAVWQITTGAFLAVTDNTLDIGADGASRPNDVLLGGRLVVNERATVTVDGATTFAVASSHTVLACTGAETINTITGGVTGMVLYLVNNDTDCTLADDDAATAANAIDLTGTATNDVGAAKKVVTLFYNGTDWEQMGESDN